MQRLAQSHAGLHTGDLQRNKREEYTKQFVFDTGGVRF
jgi:hypothetical protein